MKLLTPEEEMFSVLFQIVRTTVLGGPIGHDLMVQARSIVRRVNPRAYADLMRRRVKAGLPDINEPAESSNAPTGPANKKEKEL